MHDLYPEFMRQGVFEPLVLPPGLVPAERPLVEGGSRREEAQPHLHSRPVDRQPPQSAPLRPHPGRQSPVTKPCSPQMGTKGEKQPTNHCACLTRAETELDQNNLLCCFERGCYELGSREKKGEDELRASHPKTSLSSSLRSDRTTVSLRFRDWEMLSTSLSCSSSMWNRILFLSRSSSLPAILAASVMAAFRTDSSATRSSSTSLIILSTSPSISETRERLPLSSCLSRASRTRLLSSPTSLDGSLTGSAPKATALSMKRFGARSIVIETLLANEYHFLFPPLGFRLSSTIEVTNPALSIMERCFATRGCPRPNSFESCRA